MSAANDNFDPFDIFNLPAGKVFEPIKPTTPQEKAFALIEEAAVGGVGLDDAEYELCLLVSCRQTRTTALMEQVVALYDRQFGSGGAA
jgi:hypothetical protein